MKKKTLLISLMLILSLILLTACEGSNNTDDPGNQEKPDIEQTEDKDQNNTDNNKDKDEDKDNKNEEDLDVSSYYPIKKDTRYTYEGSGNEFASYSVYTEYIDEDKNMVQQRVDNGGTVLAEIIEIKDGAIKKIFSRSESYYREDLIRDSILDNIKEEDQEILLKEPIEKGNSWTLNDGRVRVITNLSADVSTIKGKYEAVEVTTSGPLDSKSPNDKTVDYYVKDVGLVKSTFSSDTMEVTSELKDIEDDAKLIQKIDFFYPDINDEELHHIEKEIVFKTNDVTRIKIEQAYKKVLEDVDPVVLTENTKINSLYLNNDGMVYVDLSKEFIEEMNAGAGYESKILESVADTFGNYYYSGKVVLTIDGGNYESGHILLEKGDYLEVNFLEPDTEDKIETK